MDDATLGKYYNQCDPNRALEPDDARNVNIDAEGVRGRNWSARLFNLIRYSDSPVCELFTGLPGSGKSTELKRLVLTLESNRFLPVLIDAEDAIDLTNTVDIPDVLAILVHAVERKVIEFEGGDPETALKDGYLTRLWDWVSNTDLDLKGGDLKVGDAAKLNVELKTRPTLRAKVRSVIAAHLPRFLEQVRNELNRLQARVKLTRPNGIVVIFDSLEKLRGTFTTHDEVQSSAERVFVGGRAYLEQPVHTLYTVPTYLVSRAYLAGIEFMPMIKLRDRDGRDFPPGIKVAREIIRRRIPDADMPEILGQDFETQLKRIIDASGGYPRELIRMLRLILLSEQLPASQADVQRVLNDVRDQQSTAMLSEDFPWLALVAIDKNLVVQNEAHRKVADRMLTYNAVLRYQNNSMWYDVHPLVREIPGVKAEIERQTQAARPVS